MVTSFKANELKIFYVPNSVWDPLNFIVEEINKRESIQIAKLVWELPDLIARQK